MTDFKARWKRRCSLNKGAFEWLHSCSRSLARLICRSRVDLASPRQTTCTQESSTNLEQQLCPWAPLLVSFCESPALCLRLHLVMLPRAAVSTFALIYIYIYTFKNFISFLCNNFCFKRFVNIRMFISRKANWLLLKVLWTSETLHYAIIWLLFLLLIFVLQQIVFLFFPSFCLPSFIHSSSYFVLSNHAATNLWCGDTAVIIPRVFRLQHHFPGQKYLIWSSVAFNWLHV